MDSVLPENNMKSLKELAANGKAYLEQLDDERKKHIIENNVRQAAVFLHNIIKEVNEKDPPQLGINSKIILDEILKESPEKKDTSDPK